MAITPDPEVHAETSGVLHRLAAHILARRQHMSTGRIALRPAPGGFATTDLEPGGERLRISGGLLVRESEGDASIAAAAVAIHGASLASLARFADVDISVEFSVGPQTPDLGDPDAPLELDTAASNRIGDWYGLVARSLDLVIARSPHWAAPTLPRLWPEHFDLAIDLAVDDAHPVEHRANIGGSPGDGYHAEPYLYVGPWTTDRPGDPDFWNAPFGAVMGDRTVTAADDPVERAATFLLDGIDRLRA